MKAIVPSGYLGSKGEMWLARIMPEPFSELNYGHSVVFTTPYILTEIDGNNVSPAKRKSWEAFLDRNLKKGGKKDLVTKYGALMKYGRNRHFWNEYIFEGYVTYKEDSIVLAGFPDVPLSMPHSEESQKAR